MAYSRLMPSRMVKYTVYALFLGLTVSVCAEAVLGKNLGLTPEKIEENLQVLQLVPQQDETLLTRKPAMCFCAEPKRTESQTPTVSGLTDSPTVRNPLSLVLTSYQCPPGDSLHLGPAKFPARTMSAQHRPVVSEHNGRICSRRASGRYTIPPAP